MSVENLTILPVAQADVPALLGLIRQLAEYEKLTDWFTATEDRLRQSLFGARPYAEAIIARVNGEAVGYSIFFHNFSTFSARPGIFIEDVFVSPPMRGRGIGTKLLSSVAAIARDRKCARLEWSVLNWNQPAIDLYRRLGAKPLSEWTFNRLDEPGIARLADAGAQIS